MEQFESLGCTKSAFVHPKVMFTAACCRRPVRQKGSLSAFYFEKVEEPRRGCVDGLVLFGREGK